MYVLKSEETNENSLYINNCVVCTIVLCFTEFVKDFVWDFTKCPYDVYAVVNSGGSWESPGARPNQLQTTSFSILRFLGGWIGKI